MAFRVMKSALPLVFAAALGLPAAADDFTDSVAAALDAYKAGDIKTAKREIDFAAQILAQVEAEGLKAFLPQALDGWERRDEESGAAAMAALGGGQMVAASYHREDAVVEIQIMADNQMVTALGAMFSNPALMGSLGKVKRIKGHQAVITDDGDIQALVVGRIMITVSGTADIAFKEAYFETIDLKGLAEY